MSSIPDVALPDETIAALLIREPRAGRILLSYGMHCVGCAIAPFETLAEVCAIYGVPVSRLLEDLRDTAGTETGNII
jgi:hybrid cluster-associated redox disulfide protein